MVFPYSHGSFTASILGYDPSGGRGRARTLLPHVASERMIAPPSIDELGVFSVSQVPGAAHGADGDPMQDLRMMSVVLFTV